MNHHFGKLGDVWKHLPLAEILRSDPPCAYWETHAGSATYPLTENPARRHGVIRFLERSGGDPDLASSAYRSVLRSMPGVYPGSPRIAMDMLGRQARYLFCDLDPESVGSLRAGSGDLDVRVVDQDGATMILRAARDASLDPSSVLVHIDPFDPHGRATPESMTPIELAGWLAERGFRVLYWYGYEAASERGWARAAIGERAPAMGLWCGDVWMPASFVYDERRGGWGCGIVLANATPAVTRACARLGRALERIGADDVAAGNDPERLEFREI